MIKKLRAGKKVSRVGRIAEVKIMMEIIHHTLVGIVGLIFTTFLSETVASITEELTDLFLCESMGDQECDGLSLNSINILNALGVTTTVLIGFFPVLALLFTINPRVCSKTSITTKASTSTTFCSIICTTVIYN